MLDVCSGTIIATSLWHRDLSATLSQLSGFSLGPSRFSVFAAASALALPLLFGIFRISRSLGVVLAMAALPAPPGDQVDLAAAPRRLLTLTLQLSCILAVSIPIVAISAPFLLSFQGIAALVLFLLVASVFFWRSAANLNEHVRAGAAAIAELLKSSAVAPPKQGETMDALLPGMGAPTPVVLGAGAAAIGRTLGQLNLRGLTGATVLAIRRADRALVIPAATEVLCEGDVLALAGTREAIESARALLDGQPAPRPSTKPTSAPYSSEA